MKIVLSGIYYPMAILRYFEAVLRQRDDVELFAVGPWTGNQIPWNGGMMIQRPPHPLRPPDIRVDITNRPFYRSIEEQLPWKPDLWLTIDAGFHFLGRPRNGKAFVVGTDPHGIDYDEARANSDRFFCMQTPYMKPGDIWLPYAYDPVWHAKEPDTEKIYDAGLVGAPYRERQILVAALRAEGLKVLFPGYGPVYDEARHLINQCKVGLNWSSREDTTARVFETMACGVALATNRTPDVERCGFIEHIDYEGFSNLEQGVEAVKRLLKDDTWKIVGAHGHFAVVSHTWTARVGEVLSWAGK